MGEIDYGEPPLAGATIGGEFELSNKDGETVRWADFEGQYRIVYFGCAIHVCPTDVQRTIQGLNHSPKKNRNWVQYPADLYHHRSRTRYA